MSLKILASLIILIAVVAHATKRQQRIAENSMIKQIGRAHV